MPITPYGKKGTARKRRYERPGKNGEISIRDLVLFRHKKGRHIPGLSDDMERWYEFWYFTKPNRAKDKEKYEQHVRAYRRARKWIAEVEGIEIVGDTRKIIQYPR